MKRIHVVAAVIRNAAGEILIAERPQDKHQGGLWEFPGGKVEPGEAAARALTRELEEELGIVPLHSRPLIRIAHDYPDKHVLLDVWLVTAFAGEAHGREGQPVRWVAPSGLPQFAFPAANQPIVSAARLPERLLITPESLAPEQVPEWLALRLQRGARMVLLRAPDLPASDYLKLAEKALQGCREQGPSLLLHGLPEYLGVVDADGVHLPARILMGLQARPLPAGKWLSASVHDLAELQQAQGLGLDFVTLSPVQATASHPGLPGMGWPAFAALAERATLPVYALGGVGDGDLEVAWAAGAQGVAGIRRVFAQD